MEKNSNLSDIDHLKAHLKGKVVIVGIGNTLRGDDGVGSILAQRLKGKVAYVVYDAATSPENYLGKIIKDRPDNIILIDAADIGIGPGEYRVLDSHDLKTTNLFSTHNASLSLTINYLQTHLKVDIIILAIQPKSIIFDDKISQEIQKTIESLEEYFYGKEN